MVPTLETREGCTSPLQTFDDVAGHNNVPRNTSQDTLK